MEETSFFHLLGIDNNVSPLSNPLMEEGKEHPQNLGRESENRDRDGDGVDNNS